MAILYELLAGSERALPERGRQPADTPPIVQPWVTSAANGSVRWRLGIRVISRPGRREPDHSRSSLPSSIRGGFSKRTRPRRSATERSPSSRAGGPRDRRCRRSSTGRALAVPAFVVPTATPGAPEQEHQGGPPRDGGTRSAAPGGLRAVIAMQTPRPPIDSAEVLRLVRDRAEREAGDRSACGPTSTRALGAGAHERAELSEAARSASPMDGCPSRKREGVLRRRNAVPAARGGYRAPRGVSGSIRRGVMKGEVRPDLGMAGSPPSPSAIDRRNCSLTG